MTRVRGRYPISAYAAAKVIKKVAPGCVVTEIMHDEDKSTGVIRFVVEMVRAKDDGMVQGTLDGIEEA